MLLNILLPLLMVAIFVYKKYRHYLKKSAIIFIKTNASSFDVGTLTQLKHTESVYKILYNVDSHMGACDHEYRDKWDHIVFVHCLPNDVTMEKYISDIKNVEFVDEVDVIAISTWYFPAHVIFNW